MILEPWRKDFHVFEAGCSGREDGHDGDGWWSEYGFIFSSLSYHLDDTPWPHCIQVNITTNVAAGKLETDPSQTRWKLLILASKFRDFHPFQFHVCLLYEYDSKLFLFS